MTLPKPISEIGEADLQQLVHNQVRESLQLEYKRELPAERRDKYLSEVCAFANTQGGDLIYGVEADPADNSLPLRLSGVEADDFDSIGLQLEQWARSRLEPLLEGLQVRPVPLKSGKYVVVVRIPRSWRRPHRVAGSRIFYGRGALGLYPMEMGQVRRAFLLSEGQEERIERFIADRLISAQVGEAGERLVGRARVVLHIIPLGALDPGSDQIPVDALKAVRLPTLIGDSRNVRLSLDGVEARAWGERDGAYPSVTRLFHSGMVEAIDAYSVRPDLEEEYIPSLTLEGGIARATQQYLKILSDFGVAGPAYLFLNLLAVKGLKLGLPSELQRSYLWGQNVFPLDRDHIRLPEVLINDYSTDVTDLLKPVFDRMWNAVGVNAWPDSHERKVREALAASSLG